MIRGSARSGVMHTFTNRESRLLCAGMLAGMCDHTKVDAKAKLCRCVPQLWEGSVN